MLTFPHAHAGSAIYYHNETQKKLAEETAQHFNTLLKAAGRNAVTTEIKAAGEYYYAEDYRKFCTAA